MEQVTLDNIRTMAEAAAGQIDRIFLHWSAGHYGQFFDDYHINIDYDGAIYASTDDLTEVKAHTWHQNTGAVGVAIACAYQAATNNLGPEPPTPAQLQSMAQVVRALCDGLGIPVSFEHVRTHAEQADINGYGPATTCERWDLAILRDGGPWMDGGNEIRQLAKDA